MTQQFNKCIEHTRHCDRWYGYSEGQPEFLPSRALQGSVERANMSKYSNYLDFPVAQTVKRLPTMWETWVRSLGREDPLEKEMATHSSTLAWRIPCVEEPGGLKSMGSQRVRHY